MAKKHLRREIHVEPNHIDHLSAPPKVRSSKEMNFDSLDDFHRYVKDETWDNEFDNLNLRLRYLPPFIVSQTHGQEEKIKPQMNSLNKKFRRHLNHHVQRHLLPDIKKMSGIDYEFKKAGEEMVPNAYGTSSVYKWHFEDHSNHGFDESEFANRDHWNVNVDIESNSSDPYVVVSFKATPVEQPTLVEEMQTTIV
ncbi:unnamed protein product [Ambrosiozyma monospora]|uniref:Unnamed protein product n=1 Tax=Ambrosiozyma monospora TaxID=43982 RepID=A0ACB5T3V5_AMBMO|nr:unnamed protein product [Ambrosiozyma monospora]